MTKIHLILSILLLIFFKLPIINGLNDTEKEEIFRMMFEAQDLYRTENYQKKPRLFKQDWNKCEEKYRWPDCCLWEEKKRNGRGTSNCKHIKGDVVLENDYDAYVFQSFVGLKEIQGSLILRNTTILAFGMPHLEKVGFADSNPNNLSAAITVENNPYLLQFRLRRLKKIYKHKSQKYGIIKGNPHLVLDAKQHQILFESSNESRDFEAFRPPKDRYIRFLLAELYPYFLFGVMIIGVFTYHFIMLEVNEFRVKRKEKEMIDCMIQMRDSTLAAGILLQTPCDQVLSFDKNVLHLCTDQMELIKKIEKLLEADVQAFKNPEAKDAA